MPAALSVNWEALKAAFLQGVPLPEIARQHGVSYSALRARALRYKWRSDAAEGAAMLQQAVALSMHERGQQWGGRMADLLERQLSHLERQDPASLKLSELETLTRIIDATDKAGRRTFGLEGDGRQPVVALNLDLLERSVSDGPMMIIDDDQSEGA